MWSLPLPTFGLTIDYARSRSILQMSKLTRSIASCLACPCRSTQKSDWSSLAALTCLMICSNVRSCTFFFELSWLRHRACTYTDLVQLAFISANKPSQTSGPKFFCYFGCLTVLAGFSALDSFLVTLRLLKTNCDFWDTGVAGCGKLSPSDGHSSGFLIIFLLVDAIYE